MILANPAAMRSATRWDLPGPTLRIHAGLEHSDDLLAELEAGVARFNEITRGHPARTRVDIPIFPPRPLRNRAMNYITATLEHAATFNQLGLVRSVAPHTHRGKMQLGAW